ncbi:MAG: GNAT family N-acetyltransferase [Nitriliruptoraceae bacterium]
MFALSTIEAQGGESLRVIEHQDRWALAVVFSGRLLVPCGDPELLRLAGPLTRRWRLLIGDVDAGDAALSHVTDGQGLVVHDQRFMTVDPVRVPAPEALSDPGLRLAERPDLDALTDLAVRLHVDDQFGPDPGVVGWRGYRQRLDMGLRQRLVWCVGPVGAPVCKVERAVSSARWGVQLAGIVVDDGNRHEALGRRAVATAVRHVLDEFDGRPVSLHVRAANTRAIDAYRAAGFVDREAWRLAVYS